MLSKKYFKQQIPIKIPTDDKKFIEEHFGNASTKNDKISIAHMIAPQGWSEPYQRPDFDEYVIMIRGKKIVEIDNEKIVLKEGESMVVYKGTKVRYSNPFAEEAEYWSICLPAFSMDNVHREES